MSGAAPARLGEGDASKPDHHAQPDPRPRRTVSAILVTYFTGPLLWRCIRAALAQPAVKDVIVVDNGNWPASLATLIDMAALEPRLKVVTGQGNVGFARGCNMGAKVAEGDFLLLLNPDAVVDPGGVTTLLSEGLAASPDGPWMIGGRLRNPDGTEQAGSRRQTLTPWMALVEMLRLDRLAPRHPYFKRFNNHCDPCPKKTVESPVISGACMLLPKAAYEAVGGMDERYFLHAEDIDFCLRFREAGGQIFFCPTVDVLHLKSSSRANRLRVERRKAESLTLYFQEHFPTQYPWGFVSFVCAVVWAGFGVRCLRWGAERVLSLVGLNRRRGLGSIGRAMRIAKRSRVR